MDSGELQNSDQQSGSKRGWQYSLFGLLVVMTIVSIWLAFGALYPRIVLTLLVVGMAQVVALYSLEWLMRRRGGETMKQVATSLWVVVIATVIVVTFCFVAIAIVHWILTTGGAN